MKTKLLAMMLLAGGSMFAQTRVSIGIGFGGHGAGFYQPPPSYASDIPPCPGPDYIWVDGYWSQNYGRNTWVAGYWNRRPCGSARSCLWNATTSMRLGSGFASRRSTGRAFAAIAAPGSFRYLHGLGRSSQRHSPSVVDCFPGWLPMACADPCVTSARSRASSTAHLID